MKIEVEKTPIREFVNSLSNAEREQIIHSWFERERTNSSSESILICNATRQFIEEYKIDECSDFTWWVSNMYKACLEHYWLNN